MLWARNRIVATGQKCFYLEIKYLLKNTLNSDFFKIGEIFNEYLTEMEGKNIQNGHRMCR